MFNNTITSQINISSPSSSAEGTSLLSEQDLAVQQQILAEQISALDKSAKIYVAGHRGMVGSAIVRQLRKYGFTNLVFRTHAELDLTNQAAVAEFFTAEKPDYVFLAAAKVGGILANNTYRADFIYQNLMIQNNVIHAAHEHGVKRLIFLGSSCIYPKEAPQPIKEEYLLTGPLEPTNQPYALAKIAGIDMCWSYNRQYGDKFVALMPTNLYGIGDNYHPTNSHVIPALIRKAHQAKVDNAEYFEVWGTGEVYREFLTSDEMAEAAIFVFSMSDEKLAPFLNDKEPPLFNIGTGEDCTIKDICYLIKEVVGFKGEIRFDPSKPNGTFRKLLNVDKMAKLGWRAHTDLRKGLEVAYADFLANHYQPEKKLTQLILCGGQGSRLWPLSKPEQPKQFSPAVSTPTLFEQTIHRFEGEYRNFVIITNDSYLPLVEEYCRQSDATAPTKRKYEVLLEPARRNTAPAISYATKHILEADGDQLILALPSDHFIQNPEVLYQAIEKARDYVYNNKVILTFGITPTHAENKYGYIEAGEEIGTDSGLFRVTNFKEKPTVEVAAEYLDQGNYSWNSGIFLFRASHYLQILAEQQPQMASLTNSLYLAETKLSDLQGQEGKGQEKTGQEGTDNNPHHSNLEVYQITSKFARYEDISIDYAVLENNPNIVTMPLNLEWSDMGSWEAIYAHSQKSDLENNILLGHTLPHNIKNSYIKAEHKPIIALGLENVVIVDTDDVIVVSSKDEIGKANEIVKQLYADKQKSGK